MELLFSVRLQPILSMTKVMRKKFTRRFDIIRENKLSRVNTKRKNKRSNFDKKTI